MLSPAVASKLDRLIAAYERGIFDAEEFALQIAPLTTTDNLDDLAAKLSPKYSGALKASFGLDSLRAMDEEVLVPERSPFHTLPTLNAYYRVVAVKLLEAERPGRRGVLRVVCLPSFRAEWSVRLLASQAGKPTLVYRVAGEKIYGSSTAELVLVEQREAAISTHLAGALCGIWRKFLLGVRHPRRESICLDGESYHFASHGRGVGYMAGMTWSPDVETTPGRLVLLSHLLTRLIELGEGDRADVVDRITQIVGTFEPFDKIII